MRRWQSGWSISRLVSRQRTAILNDIIINEDVKLLQINYLARKVDAMFNFPSRSHCTCNRTYGKTRYKHNQKLMATPIFPFIGHSVTFQIHNSISMSCCLWVCCHLKFVLSKLQYDGCHCASSVRCPNTPGPSFLLQSTV